MLGALNRLLPFVILSLVLASCGGKNFAKPEAIVPKVSTTVSLQSDPVNQAVIGRKPKTALVMTIVVNRDNQVLSVADPQIIGVITREEDPRQNVDGAVRVRVNDINGNEVGHAYFWIRRFGGPESAEDNTESPMSASVVSVPLSGIPAMVVVEEDNLGFGTESIDVSEMAGSFCDDYPSNSICRPQSATGIIVEDD